MPATRVLCTITVLCLLAPLAQAAVFQFHQQREVTSKKGTVHQRDVLLWIPATAPQVRGIIVGNVTLAERDIAIDPRIRAVCEEQGLAILLSKAGLGALDDILDRFAKSSDYPELRVAPLFFVGHSAGGPPARDLATRYADRCFGLMQFRGGIPGSATSTRPVPAGIPCLAMVGQFDEFAKRMRGEDGSEPAWMWPRDVLTGLRAKDPGQLVSILVEAGAGHFSWSDFNAVYLADFIRQAALARIPPNWPRDSSTFRCLPIDVQSGWLTDMDFAAADRAEAAAAKDYQGQPQRSQWHLSKSLALANEAAHRSLHSGKDQFLTWTNSFWIDAGARYFFNGMNWVAADIFHVQARYAKRYPGVKADKAYRWPRAHQPCDHADGPITLKVVSGPIRYLGEGRFQIRFDATQPAGQSARSTFMASQAGDAVYRPTEQVGMTPRSFGRLKRGKAQTITFPALPERIQADAAAIQLQARSDSGLPISYYVAYGPGRIEAGKLVITELPQHSQQPLPLAVVAYQFGSAIEPHVQSAEPVTVHTLILPATD